MQNLRRVARSILNQNSAQKLLGAFIREDNEFFREKLKDIELNLSSPMVIIFSSYQPEATSFPEAGRIHNMIDLVVEIRRLGLSGDIWFKEHPENSVFYRGDRVSPVGFERNPNFYSNLRQLGCKFFDDASLIRFSNRVECITLNGSIALERSLRGLRSFVVAEPWYGWLPGLEHLVDLGKIELPYVGHKPESALAKLNARIQGSVIPAPSHKLDKIKEPSNFAFMFPLMMSHLSSCFASNSTD
jgi:hypothetical protein